MTQSSSKQGQPAENNHDATSAHSSKKKLDRELDKALEDSFPASDPPSHSQPTSTEPAGDPHVKP